MKRIIPLVLIVLLCATWPQPCRAASTDSEPASFTLNGEPFFPFGLYHYPGGNEIEYFAELGEAGINLIRRSVSTSVDYLDAAYEQGVYVQGNIGWWVADPETRGDSLIENLNRIKDHPGLFCYDTYDEPHWNHDCYNRGPSLEQLVAGYDLVKSVDPVHPVCVNFAPLDLTEAHPTCGPDFALESYIPWTAGADVYGMDRYPVWSNPFPNENLNPVNWCCDRLREIAGPGATVYMVLQGIGMLEWDDDPENDGRRPVWEETRFMGYSSVIHGAKGILYWGQYYMDRETQLWTDIKRLAGEFRELAGPIAGGTTASSWYADHFNIEGMMKVLEGTRTLILANRSSLLVNRVEIGISGAHPGEVPVLFEDRTVVLENGRFRDDFQPWEIHVYAAESSDLGGVVVY